jgi:hypothetical protein
MSEIAKKAVQTRKQKKVGKRVAEYKKKLMLGVKDLLKDWSKNLEDKEVCVVCGDGVPKTILQEHHLNPYDKCEGKVWLCASCHNIFNKAKETTKLNEVTRDLKLRHTKFGYNIKQTFHVQ